MFSKQKEKFIREKPHCNIGTIGHVDHGKTTLTAAITKVLASDNIDSKFTSYADIDKHAEERQRGITISASHIEYQTVARHYTHIDCPGHQDYIKNMIIGAAQMDGVILVVALTEGPQDQTREHVILAKEVGIPSLIVFGNKLDMLPELDIIEFVELEVRELLGMYEFSAETPFLTGSARKALEEDSSKGPYSQAILKLMNTVDAYIPQPERPIDVPFLMPIEEIFSIPGRGTVVTGKVERGKIVVGADVEIVGAKMLKTVCTGLEMYKKILDSALAGENVGALLRGVKKDEVNRGYVLAQPGSLKASVSFRAKAYFLKPEEGGRVKPITSNYKPQFFFRTSNITGSIIVDNNGEGEDIMIYPGETTTFTVNLIEPAAINEGLRFAMREGKITLGAGIILKILD